MDGVQESGAVTQTLPPQLSPKNISAEVAGPDPGRGRTGTDGNSQHLSPAETTATALERPSRAHGRRAITQATLQWRCRRGFPPTRRSSPALQGYPKDLSKGPANPPGQLGRPRPGPTRGRAKKTGAAIYEANCITAAKVKREAHKCQLLPTCPRCQRTFRAPIGLIGHLLIKCSTPTTPPDVPPSTSASPLTPTINTDRNPEPPLPSSSVASTSAATASAPTTQS
ncbi:hypothetical protein SprV_0100270700 [Sparganum proliferum]